MQTVRFSRSFITAVILHIVIAIVFFVSLSDSLQSIQPASAPTEAHDTKEIVNAVAISEDDLSQEIKAQQAADAAVKAQAAKEAQQLAAQKAAALAQIQQAKQQQAALAAAQAADAKKAADQLAQLQQQQKLAAAQLAKTQADAAAAKKTADAQKAADAKRQAALQQQAQAAAAAKAQAMAAAKAQQAAAMNAQTQSEIARYAALIKQSIQAQWTQLPGTDQQQLATKLLLRLAPDGTVLQVQNIGSSGNAALDRLAITAAYKASPLPVPAEPQVFSAFKEFSITFGSS